MQRLTPLTGRTRLHEKRQRHFSRGMLMGAQTHIAAMTMVKTALVQITIRMVCSLIGFK